MLATLNILNLGLKDYEETYKIQKEFVKKNKKKKSPIL